MLGSCQRNVSSTEATRFGLPKEFANLRIMVSLICPPVTPSSRLGEPTNSLALLPLPCAAAMSGPDMTTAAGICAKEVLGSRRSGPVSRVPRINPGTSSVEVAVPEEGECS